MGAFALHARATAIFKYRKFIVELCAQTKISSNSAGIQQHTNGGISWRHQQRQQCKGA
jgi:hypothetical protein